MTKNITKRTVAGVLAVLCAAGVATVQPYVGGVAADTAVVASAAEVSGDYQYKVLDDGTAEISNYIGSDEVVTIPSEIGGRKVTSIGEYAFWKYTTLESVTIPNSVTTISSRAFDGCTSLVSVSLPDSLTSIESGAFNGCTLLSSVTLPDSVTSIGYSTFSSCTSLKAVTISAGMKTISPSAFNGCTSLTSVTIPDSVTKIGSSAFSTCLSLESITLPDSVRYIDTGAFYNCASLKSVTIPKSVTTIGYSAFTQCRSLVIYCYSDSAAHKYATKNKIRYVLLDGADQNPTIAYQRGDGAVRLDWTEVPGAERYAVVALVNDSWTKVTECTGTSYILRGLTAGKQYKVAVLAKIDGEWNTDTSNAITVSPNSPSYPIANAVVVDNAFSLNWSAVPNAKGYAIGYTTDGKHWKLAKTVGPSTTSLSYTNAPKGTYYFLVCANVNGKYDTSDIAKRAVKVVIR